MSYAKHRLEELLNSREPRSAGSARRMIRAYLYSNAPTKHERNEP